MRKSERTDWSRWSIAQFFGEFVELVVGTMTAIVEEKLVLEFADPTTMSSCRTIRKEAGPSHRSLDKVCSQTPSKVLHGLVKEDWQAEQGSKNKG